MMMKTLCLTLVLHMAGCSTMASRPTFPRSVIEAKFDAVNRHSIAEIVAFYAADAELTAPNFCAKRQGRADLARTYQFILGAVPDVEADVQEYVVQGDRVAVRLTIRSRLPGRAFELPIVNLFTVRQGLIIER